MAIRVNDKARTTQSIPTADLIDDIKVTRWRGGQHPTLVGIIQQLTHESLHPHAIHYGASYRSGVLSHGFSKILYCAEGIVEIALPDLDQTVTLHAGDRLDIPRGVHYRLWTNLHGATCVECTMRANTALLAVRNSHA